MTLLAAFLLVLVWPIALYRHRKAKRETRKNLTRWDIQRKMYD